jgi:hypothetical protein
MISLDSADGQHIAELSVKSHLQITEAGFPDNFVEACWEEWLHTTSSAFQNDRDLLVFATGRIAAKVIEAWHKTLREALSLCTSPERMLARLAAPPPGEHRAQSSSMQRKLFGSLHCPESLKCKGRSDELATVDLLKRIRVLYFDFQSEPSNAESRAIADCRSVLRSSDANEAKQLWNSLLRVAANKRETGGSVDLAELLSHLREQFVFRDHPDYRADWDSLGRVNRDVLDDIHTDIAGILSLPRPEDIENIAEVLTQSRICLTVGESGCGKSAIAKMIGEQKYARVIALPWENLDSGRQMMMEASLNLQHPLTEVLRSSPVRTLIILDSVEHLTDNGARLAGRIIAEVLRDTHCEHIHVLITSQYEASRPFEDFVKAGVDRTLLEPVQIDNPPESEINKLLLSINSLPGLTLSRALRPLIRNLKILDWVVRASQAGQRLPGTNVTGLVTLIDYLWNHWVETGNNSVVRNELLKRIAVLEGDTLSTSIPLSELDSVHLQAVQELIDSAVLRIRNERVRFTHDLLGDWARLRVLIGQCPTTSPDNLRRYSDLRWHRAIRLYGRWLLGQPNGIDRWTQEIAGFNNGTSEGTIICALLLEAVILNENSQYLLEQVWPVLVQNGATLLHRLLDRFLFVATLPDPRLRMWVPDSPITAQLEATFRIPFWPYWGAMLSTLHKHVQETITLAPIGAAKICRMWLEKIPVEIQAGRPFPWRHEAADLAIKVAREMQARQEEGHYWTDHEDRIAYEAALLAAPEYPDDVSALILELARRRPLSPTIQERAVNAKRAAAETERHRDPESQRQLEKLRSQRLTVIPGPRRKPWPDGPTDGVDESFREAVLGSQGIISVAVMRPDVALEVLLAVCIEEPGYDNDSGGSDFIDDFGIDDWGHPEPPMFFRGPFLMFLRQCPTQGIEFVLRLVNFASARWTEGVRLNAMRWKHPLPTDDDLSVSVQVPSGEKRWIGDSQVYRWYLDCPVNSHIIPCVLMALEKWIYERIDAEEEIDISLREIMDRSETVAFAGLLCDVGKKYTKLFARELRPLLGTWIFYLWDQQIVQERSYMPIGMMGWFRDPRELVEIARGWHTAEYRRYDLSRIASWFLVNDANMKQFFSDIVRKWRSDLSSDGQNRDLQILIEQLTYDNYRQTPVEGGKICFEFVLPPRLEATVQKDRQVADERLLLLTFPTTCRKILDNQSPIDDPQSLWNTLQSIVEQDVDDPDSSHRKQDAVTGGIAILICKCRDWLHSDASKESWCFEFLQDLISSPPLRGAFDCPESARNCSWDYFLAEIGVQLLAENPADEYARSLVAHGVAGYHYGATKQTMQRVYEHRHLLGDLFVSLQHLAIRWAMIRRLRGRSEQLADNRQHLHQSSPDDAEILAELEAVSNKAQQWRNEHDLLIARFVDGNLEPIDLRQARAIVLKEMDQLDDICVFPFGRSRRRTRHDTTFHRPRKAFRSDIGLDTTVLCSAFDWLGTHPIESPGDRNTFARLTNEFISLLLESLVISEEEDVDEIDGLPDGFDGWVYGIVCSMIVQMDDGDDPALLWRPILDLGVYAHKWVERFFWHWFIEGINTSASTEAFVSRWTEMIRFALASPKWATENVRTFYLDDMVCELLGYHFGADSMASEERFAPPLGAMSNIMEQAAQKWFSMPGVANGFARCLVKPGYDQLLCQGVRWLHQAVINADDYELWRQQDVEDHLIGVLQKSWDRYPEVVVADCELRSAFRGLVTVLSSRGSHAALELQNRLLTSISTQD